MSWKLGPVGHFGLSVRDHKASATWWIEKIGLEKQFDFPGGIAIGNDAITIVLTDGVPHPGTFGHMAFRLPNMTALRAALADLRERGVKLEDPGDEIGPQGEGSQDAGIWFHDPDGYRWEFAVNGGLRKGG